MYCVVIDGFKELKMTEISVTLLLLLEQCSLFIE